MCQIMLQFSYQEVKIKISMAEVLEKDETDELLLTYRSRCLSVYQHLSNNISMQPIEDVVYKMTKPKLVNE